MGFVRMAMSSIIVSIGFAAASSWATTLLVDGDGQFTGATRVNVGGSLYDVDFKEGSCIGLFNGCDELSDFTFTTETGAKAAAQALLDQVFIDGPAGDFDMMPTLTFGCTSEILGCRSIIAFGPGSYGLEFGADVVYSSNQPPDSLLGRPDEVMGPEIWGREHDTADFGDYNWAVWSPSATGSTTAVPVPAGGLLLLTGLGGIVALRRRKKPSA